MFSGYVLSKTDHGIFQGKYYFNRASAKNDIRIGPTFRTTRKSGFGTSLLWTVDCKDLSYNSSHLKFIEVQNKDQVPVGPEAKAASRWLHHHCWGGAGLGAVCRGMGVRPYLPDTGIMVFTVYYVL